MDQLLAEMLAGMLVEKTVHLMVSTLTLDAKILLRMVVAMVLAKDNYDSFLHIYSQLVRHCSQFYNTFFAYYHSLLSHRTSFEHLGY